MPTTVPIFQTTVIGLTPLVVVLLIVLASTGVLLELIRRQTKQRVRFRLRDWAAANGLAYLRPGQSSMPKPMDELVAMGRSIVVRSHFADGRGVHLLQFEVDQNESFNVLIMRRETDNPRVGLRPTGAQQSLCDLFEMPSAPRQIPGIRFTICGEDWLATRELADGMARGLLPGDLSLVRTLRHLLIDFSSRPFDEIELTRVRSLATQMASVV